MQKLVKMFKAKVQVDVYAQHKLQYIIIVNKTPE